MVKHKQKSNTSLDKVFVRFGLALVIVGSLSSLYYAYANQPFILNNSSAPMLYLSYFSYLITLGGGFLVGYLLTKRGKEGISAWLLSGVTYGLLATIFYFLFFAIHFLLRLAYGEFTYPWGMILFSGMPLYALIVTAIVAYLFQYRSKSTGLHPKIKLVFVIAFLLNELYSIGNTVYYTMLDTSPHETVAQSPWLAIASYLLNPLFLMMVTYLLLGRVKDSLQRLFYASFIASFSSILMLVLWNFNTDPYIDSVVRFQIFTGVILVLVTVLFILKARTAAKQK